MTRSALPRPTSAPATALWAASFVAAVGVSVALQGCGSGNSTEATKNETVSTKASTPEGFVKGPEDVSQPGLPEMGEGSSAPVEHRAHSDPFEGEPWNSMKRATGQFKADDDIPFGEEGDEDSEFKLLGAKPHEDASQTELPAEETREEHAREEVAEAHVPHENAPQKEPPERVNSEAWSFWEGADKRGAVPRAHNQMGWKSWPPPGHHEDGAAKRSTGPDEYDDAAHDASGLEARNADIGEVVTGMTASEARPHWHQEFEPAPWISRNETGMPSPRHAGRLEEARKVDAGAVAAEMSASGARRDGQQELEHAPRMSRNESGSLSPRHAGQVEEAPVAAESHLPVVTAEPVKLEEAPVEASAPAASAEPSKLKQVRFAAEVGTAKKVKKAKVPKGGGRGQPTGMKHLPNPVGSGEKDEALEFARKKSGPPPSSPVVPPWISRGEGPPMAAAPVSVPSVVAPAPVAVPSVMAPAPAAAPTEDEGSEGTHDEETEAAVDVAAGREHLTRSQKRNRHKSRRRRRKETWRKDLERAMTLEELVTAMEEGRALSNEGELWAKAKRRLSKEMLHKINNARDPTEFNDKMQRAMDFFDGEQLLYIEEALAKKRDEFKASGSSHVEVTMDSRGGLVATAPRALRIP